MPSEIGPQQSFTQRKAGRLELVVFDEGSHVVAEFVMAGTKPSFLPSTFCKGPYAVI